MLFRPNNNNLISLSFKEFLNEEKQADEKAINHYC